MQETEMPTQSQAPQQNLLTREQAAAYLGLKPQTLASWAAFGRHDLPYYKIGSRAMYRRADLDDWLERRRITCAAEAE